VVAVGGLRAPWWQLDGRPVAGRLAPSLRGLGLLARIPAAQLRSLADPDDQDGDGISGRVGEGRFGLKAEHPTLEAQIALALALDMGIATAAHPSTAGDCTSEQAACIVRAGSGIPTPRDALDGLVAYVEALRPRLAPSSVDGREGAALFAAAGCGACHAGPFTVTSEPAVTGRSLEAVAPFTDLLLHDLGPDMADPFPGVAAGPGEWRTAPLWGLRLRPVFLHDGRAASVREAILWHGGEAERSRDRFLALAPAAQARLLAFLQGI
jgi:CxxC motif-containing protein (DUF1111 family)